MPIITDTVWNKETKFSAVYTLDETGVVTEHIRDAIVFPHKVVKWDWAWCGKADMMHHKPGYRMSDLTHFIESANSDTVLILTKGREEALQVSDEVLSKVHTMGFK